MNVSCNSSPPKNFEFEKLGRGKTLTDEGLAEIVQETPDHIPEKAINLPDLPNDDPDAIFTISTEIICANVRSNLVSDPKKVTEISSEQNIESESVRSRPRTLSDVPSKPKRPRRKKKRHMIPNAEDYKPNLPISEARLVNIPLTSAVICVSRKDIICTASLSLQVLCLLATHFSIQSIGQRIQTMEGLFLVTCHILKRIMKLKH